MLKLGSILTAMMVYSVMVGSISAAINPLVLSNPPDPFIMTESDNPNYDLITKIGTGTCIVNISLSNTGDTIINTGVLQFNGSTIDLQKVSVGGNNLTDRPFTAADSGITRLVVGDGINSTNVTASSINIDTLDIAAGSTFTLLPATDVVTTTPEPASMLIWILVGLTAVLSYRLRK